MIQHLIKISFTLIFLNLKMTSSLKTFLKIFVSSVKNFHDSFTQISPPQYCWNFQNLSLSLVTLPSNSPPQEPIFFPQKQKLISPPAEFHVMLLKTIIFSKLQRSKKNDSKSFYNNKHKVLHKR